MEWKRQISRNSFLFKCLVEVFSVTFCDFDPDFVDALIYHLQKGFSFKILSLSNSKFLDKMMDHFLTKSVNLHQEILDSEIPFKI